LAALYVGPPYSDLLIVAVCAVAGWEWARMCRHGRWDWVVGLVVGFVVLAVGFGILGYYALAGWSIAVGALAVGFAPGRVAQADAAWLGLGVVYIAGAGLAFLWLRQEPESGRAVVLWLVAVVWSTDVGAYFAGRLIGGPKLAPGISPKKTWSGLGGGVAAAVAAGLAASWWLTMGPIILGLASAVLAIVAQLGDLLESGLKRRYGFKDSSALIPGHGGLLDRIDGLLSAVLVLGGMDWLMGAVR